ncbi:MAG: hypothetical protein K2K06_12520 [Oscillospiraceae bacterium]|nr:hypothetical protein [Oscillospiraceae bacterium]
MTLTTILLFGLAIMGLILLIMIIISSSRTMFTEKNTDSIDDDEDDAYENKDEEHENHSVSENKLVLKNTPKNFKTETACVIFKSDERKRLLDEYHHSSIRNEKFELIFETSKGDNFSLACSKSAHQQMPYREIGTVTFKDNKFIKFESGKQTISDEYTLT